MRRLFCLVLASVIVIAAPAAASAASHPDVPGREITRWEQTIQLREDGSIRVDVDFDFDFGDDPGHGPYLYVVTRQHYDADNDRRYRLTDVGAWSTSGAPDQVDVEEGRSAATVRIGDPDIDDVSGMQSYHVHYTLQHVANATTEADTGSSGLSGDELYWNAIGDGWTIPISSASVTVSTPGEVTAVECFAGRYGGATACGSAAADGGTAVFTQDYLEPGEPFTIAVLMPAGTVDTTPDLVVRRTWSNAFRVTPVTVTAAAIVAAVGAVILWVGLRSGVDRQYASPAPATGPGDAATQRRDYDAIAPLRRVPPERLRPGLIGALVDEKADVRDVTATLVDLAVRGYLRVEDVVEASDPGVPATGPTDYRLVKLKDADGELYAYEHTLMQGLFADRDQVTLEEIRTTFSSVLTTVRHQLDDAMVEWGWFKRAPRKVRLSWGLSGAAILLAGLFLTLILTAIAGWGIVPLPLIPLGLAMLFTIPNVPARTAEGTRVLMEAKGFEEYVSWPKVELVTEPGEDGRTFSQFLPYAIAFGATSVWAGKWAALAAGGVALAEPTWMAAYGATSVWSSNIDLGARLDNFSTTASSVMSAPAPSSSGGSGGSGFGGGGFSGGGGGGGGGGGW